MSHVDICRKRGLVDAQTSKTKRSFADIQQNVLHDSVAGSKAHPLQMTGTPLAGMCSFGLLISELMLKPFQHACAVQMAHQPLARLCCSLCFSRDT